MSFTSISVVCSIIIVHLNEKKKNFCTEKHLLPKHIRDLFIRKLVIFLGMKNLSKQLLSILVKHDKDLSKDENHVYKPLYDIRNCTLNFDDFFEIVANDLIHKENSADKNYNTDNSEPIWVEKKKASKKPNNLQEKKCFSNSDKKKNIKNVNSDLEYIYKRENVSLLIYYEWTLVVLGEFKKKI
jgi:hypothetical protein